VKLKTFLASTLILLTASAWAQMAPKPGAEVKKLEFLVGTWTTEGTIAEGPWGSGGKFSATNTSEWMPGNFFVVGHSDAKMPLEIGGESSATSFTGYDTDENVYTRDEFNTQGRRNAAKGTVTGDTWTWTSSQTYNGMDIKQKLTMKVLSPTSYTFKFEISMDGTTWTPFMEGKATKK